SKGAVISTATRRPAQRLSPFSGRCTATEKGKERADTQNRCRHEQLTVQQWVGRTKRCFGERQRSAHRGGLWLARIAAGVAGPQRAIGTNAKCAAPPISYTRADQARHVLCRSLG